VWNASFHAKSKYAWADFLIAPLHPIPGTHMAPSLLLICSISPMIALRVYLGWRVPLLSNFTDKKQRLRQVK
jgi:hypothetical protein